MKTGKAKKKKKRLPHKAHRFSKLAQTTFLCFTAKIVFNNTDISFILDYTTHKSIKRSETLSKKNQGQATKYKTIELHRLNSVYQFNSQLTVHPFLWVSIRKQSASYAYMAQSKQCIS